MSTSNCILWIDDEVEMLRPHILFLENKGYALHTVSNGQDALDLIKSNPYDLIFLDDNMPGLRGIETLKLIKEINPTLPVVMITKSEEEDVMNKAIGSKIADYLIKPVNPNQVLMSIKKVLHHRQIITEHFTADYREEFGKIAQQLNDARCIDDWYVLYRKMTDHNISLRDINDESVHEILSYQHNEVNNEFCKFISRNYLRWFDRNSPNDRPLMSHTLLRDKLFPMFAEGEKVAFMLVDNLRYDQWRAIMPIVQEYYRVERDELYCTILPTATQYARNAIFAGLMPSEIEKLTPDYWLNDEEDGGKNQFEEEFLRRQMQRYGVNATLYFRKMVGNNGGRQMLSELHKLDSCNFAALIYNFVDELSHARTSSHIVRGLAEDEAAYRSLTRSWFEHSDLLELFKELSARRFKILLSSDHGTVRVSNPVKIVGDRNTSTNLRYKTGKALSYEAKEVFEIVHPEDAFLPRTNLSSRYVFARNRDFFAYPNNYNANVKYYRDTFQHGGISMEEMLVPMITMTPNV
ncbi:MAG: bifunctional response regulator/alkaline phosphatase family protein [Prevotellaceae bacterium]|nr:bifunctional response regulator/alkaline phosphatase family protein [Prevotellaceae bacterium]